MTFHARLSIRGEWYILTITGTQQVKLQPALTKVWAGGNNHTGTRRYGNTRRTSHLQTRKFHRNSVATMGKPSGFLSHFIAALFNLFSRSPFLLSPTLEIPPQVSLVCENHGSHSNIHSLLQHCCLHLRPDIHESSHSSARCSPGFRSSIHRPLALRFLVNHRPAPFAASTALPS